MAGGRITSPTGTAPDRYNYYPGTEALGPDEMRVIACGSGMPMPRTKQAAACFLIELGNGEKLIFDIGTGSLANLAALEIPFTHLDKVFISHLHVDHIGDLDALWFYILHEAEKAPVDTITAPRPPIVLADFESGNYADWKVTGTAFITAESTLLAQENDPFANGIRS